MPASGLFITLFDEETLTLYLDRGIYGFHMPPMHGEVPTRSRHYAALADYACAREGTHVFFFLKRAIVYGGQIMGSKDYGSFYLNGPYSPLGRKANSKVFWDESNRRRYSPTTRPGIFTRPQIDTKEVCQPYIIRFKDRIGLKGQAILSDQLYFALGEYPYPLPTNSISGMSFCTMTPGETEKAIELIREEPLKEFPITTSETTIPLEEESTLFRQEFGIPSVEEEVIESESHLEASIIANPKLLPKELRPNGSTICRQVPISPFKPSQMDRADICYYEDEKIRDGTVPNVVIELKNKTSGKSEMAQIERYLNWLHKRLKSDAHNIEVFLVAPSFTRNISIPSRYKEQIKLITFEECK